MSCFNKFGLGCVGKIGTGGIIGRFAAARGGRVVAAAVVAAAVVAAATLLSNCGTSQNPVDPDNGAYGSVVIRGRVDSPQLAKAAADLGFDAVSNVQDTKPAKLIIQVTGTGIDTIRVENAIDPARPSIVDTIPKIPAGKARRISIWAVGGNGAVTHIDSLESRTVDVAANTVTPVYAVLIPASGSIYLLFNGLATSVDSIKATFKKNDGTLVAESRAKRAPKTFMTLDNIPHLTAGILRVEIISTSGELLYAAAKELTFNARGDNNIDLRFSTPDGSAGVNIDLRVSGVTLGAYDFSVSESAVTESGELVITEILWNASNDNYIELYNPANAAVSFDTLITDIDGTKCKFAGVNVPAKGFFVIGRQYQDYINASPPSASNLPITATGNWIAVKRKNGAVIDRVICPGSANNAMGWPTVSGSSKKSIELMKDKYSAADNDFGKNWRVTTGGAINTVLSIYGTPGKGADF
jgi:hypothetical protein